MTIRDLRNFCNKKPDSISWKDFDNMEVTVTGELGMEYLADFEENSGVTAIPKEDGTIGYVFNLLTEDIEEQLRPSDEMDEFASMDDDYFNGCAMWELRMYNQENLENNLN